MPPRTPVPIPVLPFTDDEDREHRWSPRGIADACDPCHDFAVVERDGRRYQAYALACPVHRHLSDLRPLHIPAVNLGPAREGDSRPAPRALSADESAATAWCDGPPPTGRRIVLDGRPHTVADPSCFRQAEQEASRRLGGVPEPELRRMGRLAGTNPTGEPPEQITSPCTVIAHRDALLVSTRGQRAIDIPPELQPVVAEFDELEYRDRPRIGLFTPAEHLDHLSRTEFTQRHLPAHTGQYLFFLARASLCAPRTGAP